MAVGSAVRLKELYIWLTTVVHDNRAMISTTNFQYVTSSKTITRIRLAYNVLICNNIYFDEYEVVANGCYVTGLFWPYTNNNVCMQRKYVLRTLSRTYVCVLVFGVFSEQREWALD